MKPLENTAMHNILIIDDQARDIRNIERSLRKLYNEDEIKIHVAHSYNDAQAIIYSGQINITVMFIDIILDEDDDKDGISIAENIFPYRQDLPFIIVSGHYFEKVKEVNNKLLGLEQYIGFLDKAEFMPEDILDMMDKAERFILKKAESTDALLPDRESPAKEGIPLETLLSLVVQNYSFHEKAVKDIKKSDDLDFLLNFLGHYDRNPKYFRSEKFGETTVMEIKAKHMGEAYRIFAKPGSPKGVIYRVLSRHPKSYNEIKMWLNRNVV